MVSQIDFMKFSDKYRKSTDLKERLDRGDKVWNFDREKSIFTVGRGYKFGKQDKEEIKTLMERVRRVEKMEIRKMVVKMMMTRMVEVKR